MIYRINTWLVSRYSATNIIAFSPLSQSISLVYLIDLCLLVFPRSLTFLPYNVSWTYFCSQFRQPRYMICRPRVIGILFLLHTFLFQTFGMHLYTIVLLCYCCWNDILTSSERTNIFIQQWCLHLVPRKMKNYQQCYSVRMLSRATVYVIVRRSYKWIDPRL